MASRLRPGRAHPAYYPLRQLARAMEQAARETPAGGVALDYGCGEMPYRALFTERVSRYVGADLAANPAAEVVLNPDGTVPWPDESCDLVLSTQVLEHVDDSARYLAEAWRLLRPGGELLLSTHGYWRYHPSPRDLWRWTSSGLQAIIGDAGFEVVRFHGLVGAAAAGIQIWQDAVRDAVPGPLRPLFFFLVQGCVEVQDRLTPAPRRAADACIYLLRARKHGGSGPTCAP